MCELLHVRARACQPARARSTRTRSHTQRTAHVLIVLITTRQTATPPPQARMHASCNAPAKHTHTHTLTFAGAVCADERRRRRLQRGAALRRPAALRGRDICADQQVRWRRCVGWPAGLVCAGTACHLPTLCMWRVRACLHMRPRGSQQPCCCHHLNPAAHVLRAHAPAHSADLHLPPLLLLPPAINRHPSPLQQHCRGGGQSRGLGARAARGHRTALDRTRERHACTPSLTAGRMHAVALAVRCCMPAIFFSLASSPSLSRVRLPATRPDPPLGHEPAARQGRAAAHVWRSRQRARAARIAVPVCRGPLRRRAGAAPDTAGGARPGVQGA